MQLDDALSSIDQSVASGHGRPVDPPPLVLRSALEIAAQPQTALWLLKGLVECNALLLMFGELGSLKSFLALDWALQIADAGHPVIYLHAEGRGLWRRLRAWAMYRYPDDAWEKTLERLPFHAIERPVNLSADLVVLTLQAVIQEKLGQTKPALIVVDTMSRNSDGSVERSSEDATIYLNRLDNALRATYQCSVLLVHHVGHTNQDRARGPYVLMANTDCNYSVERPDKDKLEIVLKVGRMKDTESPPPMQYVAEVVELDVKEEDGRQATSLLLRSTGTAPAAAKKPGKNQQKSLTAIVEWARTHPAAGHISTVEAVELLKAQGLRDRQRRHECMTYLVAAGVLTPAVGGHTLNRDAL